jgi:hypothetical protein
MALPGLVAANNLSDAADREAVWSNLGDDIDAAIPTTNLLLRSEEFENASWITSNSSVVANVQEAPDGTSEADKLVENTADAQHDLTQLLTIPDNSLVTVSAYFKAAERNWGRISVKRKDGTFPGAYFNLSNGTIGTVIASAPVSVSIVSAGNSWYRCSATARIGIGATTPGVRILVNNADLGLSYSGDGTSGIYLWGAQLELAEEAGPYVPTTTVPVSASPTASIVIEGDDILELTGVRIASVADFVRIKGLATPAQPRLTTAAANAGSGTVLRDNALLKASPSSEGDFFITRGTLDGQSLRVNGLAIASISGGPFSGSTASCPLSISSFAAPTNLRLNNAMTSGTLAFPEKAIPIETNDFILYAKAGQS